MGGRKSRAIENLVLRKFSPGITTLRGLEKDLRRQGYVISRQTISNIINSKGKRRESEVKGEIFKKYQPRKKVTRRVLKTIDTLSSRENVPSHSFMAEKAGVSPSTVNKVIHRYLNKETKKKRKVHVLNMREKQNRMQNCIKLYKNNLAGEKCLKKFVKDLILST